MKILKTSLALNFFKKVKKYLNKLQQDEAYVSYPIEKIIKQHRSRLKVKLIYSFLELSNLKYNKSEVEGYLDEFDYVFGKSPIKEHESGFGYNEGVFFYTLLKIINPEIVIESGVMKGFTTYLIDTATHGNCKIYSYYINFENNMFNSKKLHI